MKNNVIDIEYNNIVIIVVVTVQVQGLNYHGNVSGMAVGLKEFAFRERGLGRGHS